MGGCFCNWRKENQSLVSQRHTYAKAQGLNRNYVRERVFLSLIEAARLSYCMCSVPRSKRLTAAQQAVEVMVEIMMW